MKITVLVSPSQKECIPRLKDFFEQRYLSSSFFLIDPNWTLNGEEQMIKVLGSGYNFLYVCDYEDLSSQWVLYVTGFSQEGGQQGNRRINSAFFLNGLKRSLPQWMKKFHVINSYKTLHTFFSNHNSEWNKKSDIVVAKFFMEKMGYYEIKKPIFTGNKELDLLYLELYLEAGGDPNYVDDDGVPLLCQVIRRDDKKLVYHLIPRGCDINIEAKDRETTPLMESASRGHEDLVSLFIQSGANLEHKSKEGQTALILAMGNQNKDSARLLIEAGADGRVTDHLEMSAFKYATLYKFTELILIMDEKNE